VVGGRRLSDFQPQWLAVGEGRSEMGVSLLCPGHWPLWDPRAHRVRLWFSNPGDGGPPLPVQELLREDFRTLYWRSGDELDHLTISGHHGDGEPLELGSHGAFWVIEGQVYERLIRAIGW
jgi:hypothetical protein